MGEIWLRHYSTRPWNDPAAWEDYLQAASGILGGPVTHLDHNDPVRRAAEPGKMGAFITTFAEREESRWVFGRLRTVKCGLLVRLQRGLGPIPNSVTWTIPEKHIARLGPEPLVELFELGVRCLSPFYSYADDIDAIAARKRSSGAVNMEAELTGAFWLVAFGPEYVAFFGSDRVRSHSSAAVRPDGSAIFRLARTAAECEESQRKALEAALGASSFVDPQDEQIKRPGRFALTLKQLASASSG